MTATGARGLTPGYSPPEQYGTARTDARSDIYALGATLYTALTGFPPEDGLAVAIKQTNLTGIRTVVPEVSTKVADVIEKALQVEADDRYQTGKEFKQALTEASDTINRQVATGEVTVSPPAAQRSIPWGWIIGGAAVGGIALLLVVFMVSGLLFNRNGDQADVPTSTAAAVAVETDVEETLPAEDTPVAEDVVPKDTPDTPVDEPTEPTPTTGPVTTPTGGGGLIAFASTRSGDPQIFLYDLATGEVTQLTNIGGGACQPSWSPDGQSLAVVVPCPENQQRYDGSSLFKVNLADGTHSPLPSSPIGDYDPDWSPVENKIVFTSIRDFDRPQIWVVDIDTGEAVNLSNNSQYDYQPVWASDGSKIMFSSNRVIARGTLWVMDVDGQNVVEMTKNDSRTNIEAVWGSDGDLVIYSQFDGSGGGVPRLMGNYWRDGGPQAGTVEFRISDSSLGMREADLSPDGLWIVFSGGSNPQDLDVYIMRVNGAEMEAIILDDGANDFDPAWQPTP
jgi:Tol biopolymer transport system component